MFEILCLSFCHWYYIHGSRIYITNIKYNDKTHDTGFWKKATNCTCYKLTLILRVMHIHYYVIYSLCDSDSKGYVHPLLCYTFVV